MAKIWNVSTGLLVLPNGVEIAPGAGITLPKEYADNAGVASWLEDGLASENPAPAAALDELTAERIKTADLEAQIAALQKDLEAATKPAK